MPLEQKEHLKKVKELQEIKREKNLNINKKFYKTQKKLDRDNSVKKKDVQPNKQNKKEMNL